MIPRARCRGFFFAAMTVLAAKSASADPPKETPKETKARCIDADTRSQSLRRNNDFQGAREQLKVCMDPRCPRMVRDDCTQRLDDLERAQPSIVFEAKDPDGADLSAVKVTVDGHAWAEKLDGTALAADAGEHEFTFEVVGQPPVTRRFILREGEKDRRETVVIGIPKPQPALPSSVITPTPPPEREWGVGRPIGLALGGVGLGGIAAGVVFGVLAKAAIDSQKNECDPTVPTCAKPMRDAAVTDHDSAVRDGIVSDVGFIGGGVLLAGGAALFFLSRPGAALSPGPTTGLVVVPTVDTTGGNLAVVGRF